MPRCVHIDGEDRRVVEWRQSLPPSTRVGRQNESNLGGFRPTISMMNTAETGFGNDAGSWERTAFDLSLVRSVLVEGDLSAVLGGSKQDTHVRAVSDEIHSAG